jgi:hypothetical protein
MSRQTAVKHEKNSYDKLPKRGSVKYKLTRERKFYDINKEENKTQAF